MNQNYMEQNTAQKLAEVCEQKLKASYTDVTCSIQENQKLNGVTKTALVIHRADDNISPVIYVDNTLSKINDGILTFEDAANNVCRQYESNIDTIDVPPFDRAMANDALYVVAVNRNLNRELLDSTPHRDIAGDVSLVMRIKCGEFDDGRATALVSNQLLTKFQLTSDEAFEIATNNTIKDGYTIATMGETLKSLGIPEEIASDMDSLPMMVISNHDKQDGAVNIFVDKDVRKQLVERFDSGVWCIPSSRHEVIAVPESLGDPLAIKEMISQVNHSELQPEDILSEDLFHISTDFQLTAFSEELHSLADGIDEVSDMFEAHAAHI